MSASTKSCLLSLVVLAGTGCNVIKPDLLGADAQGASDGPRQNDAGADVAPDAYVAFEGNLVEANADLETGATGWITNGGAAQIASSTAQAHAGTASLLTTMRTGEWNGPAVNLLGKVRPGRTYSATIWARLTAAATDKFLVSIRHTCLETGTTERFNVNNNRTSVVASEGAWRQPTSTFTVVDPSACSLTSFIVYVETENPVFGTFYVDDIDIREQP
ncbi:MAG: carbohydrate binding domain-containing protein [Kofleriaceae bacterium]